MPVRRGCPRGPRHRDLVHRATAGQVGGRGVQPVPAADERAGAERGVGLVAGEDDVVGAGRGEREGPVRDELRAVDQHAGTAGPGERDDLGQRQRLPGDVGRPGDRDQRVRRPGQLVAQRPQGADDGGRGGQHGDRPAALPRQQVGVVLAVEHQHRAALGDRAREQVERVGGVPGEHADVVGTRADEPRDGVARATRRGPWTPATGTPRPGARWRRAAAPPPPGRRPTPAPGCWPRSRGRRTGSGRRGPAGPPCPLPRRGAAGRRRAAVGGPGRGRGGRTWGCSWRVGDPGHGSALAAAGPQPPGRHPGHPIAEEGCRPASRGFALALVTCRHSDTSTAFPSNPIDVVGFAPRPSRGEPP